MQRPGGGTSMVCCKEQQGGHCSYSRKSKEERGGCVHGGSIWVMSYGALGVLKGAKLYDEMGSRWRVVSKGL